MGDISGNSSGDYNPKGLPFETMASYFQDVTAWLRARTDKPIVASEAYWGGADQATRVLDEFRTGGGNLFLLWHENPGVAGLLVDGNGALTDYGPVFRAYRAAHPATNAPPPPAADTAGAVVVDDAAVGTGPNQFSYAGEWQTSAGAGKYAGSDHYSATAGATATVRFTGTGITLYGAKAPWHGTATVSVDGGPAGQD
ncbi:MAG TPA: hypothetical protein VKP11_02465, partial [Frankiaceae bacterium]|nr:hypothetical protein [Frankiaceae bacterium]